MERKDYFSGHSKLYANFRPVYPAELYQFIYKYLNRHETAWDCATGNGQVARELAKHFEQVYATDISVKQIEHAYKADNIYYSVCPAEETAFHNYQFDLITVAQALHWFNVDDFYKEVRRVGKENALIAVWGYELCRIDENTDKLFLDFYHNIVGPHWDNARKLVENEYRDIPFPFEIIESPRFFIEADWSLENFLGYLTTWSATQKYIKEKGRNPVEDLASKLTLNWNSAETRKVTFPVFLKLGRIQ
jgi:hypothetical protein